MAAKNLDLFGTYKTKKDTIILRAGVKKLDDIVDLSKDKWATMIAGGEDDLEAMQGMEQAIEQERSDLVSAVDDPAANKSLIAELKDMGIIAQDASDESIKGNAESIKAQVKSMGEDKIWSSVDKKNAEASKSQADKDAAEMIKMGKEQGNLTTSMVDKLGLIFDALYNQIYTVLMDIDGILNPLGSVLKKQALTSKNSEVTAAWGKGGGDVAKYMGALSSSKTAKGIDDLLHSTDPKDMAKVSLQKSDIANTFGMSSLTGDVGKDLADALKFSGVGGSDAARILSAQKGGADVRGAISAGGLSDKAEADLYSKMALWFTSAEGRANIMGAAPGIANFNASGGGGVAASTAQPPTPQQAASQKSENPGTGGASVVAAPPAAPTVPGAGPAASTAPGGLKMPTLPDQQKMNEAVLEQVDFTGEATVNSLQDLWKALRMKGVKLDKVQLNGEYQDVIHKGTADGARDALFEYALYTSSNPAATLKKMKASGFGGLDKLADTFEDQQKSKTGEKLINVDRGPHAAGGIVTDVGGGLANVSPAPGEGLASIGRGERIVPAGGGGAGGGGIHIHVNGIGGQDLANYLSTKIAQGVHEYKRREKFN